MVWTAIWDAPNCLIQIWRTRGELTYKKCEIHVKFGRPFGMPEMAWFGMNCGFIRDILECSEVHQDDKLRAAKLGFFKPFWTRPQFGTLKSLNSKETTMYGFAFSARSVLVTSVKLRVPRQMCWSYALTTLIYVYKSNLTLAQCDQARGG